MLPNIYQVVLVNIAGMAIYSGFMEDIAFGIAENSGFECNILLDGKLIASYSPISGFKEFTND